MQVTDPDYTAMDVKQLPKWVDLAVGLIVGFIGGIGVSVLFAFIQALRLP